jgi:hypothetical protein
MMVGERGYMGGGGRRDFRCGYLICGFCCRVVSSLWVCGRRLF